MTSDFQSTLSAIDDVAVHHCGHCGKALANSAPSKLWCGEACQEFWNDGRGDQLEGQDDVTYEIRLPVYGLREVSLRWLEAEYKAMWLDKIRGLAEWEPVNPDEPCSYEWLDPDPWTDGTLTGIFRIFGRLRRIDARGNR